MSADDRISRQTARLYFKGMDHVALYGSFADSVEHIDKPYYYSDYLYYQTAYMKGADELKKDIIWRKFFPDTIVILPWDSSSVQSFDLGNMVVYPKLGCYTRGEGCIKYVDRYVGGLNSIQGFVLAGKFAVFSRGFSYGLPSTNELIISLEDGRTRVTYKPKLYMGPKREGEDYTEQIIGTKNGIMHLVTDYPNSTTHLVYMAFTNKKSIDPTRDDVIVSETDCGAWNSILTYRQQQIDSGTGKPYFVDSTYDYYSDFKAPNLLITEHQYYSDRNRTYFRTMSPTGSKSSRIGFLQTARGYDSPVMCLSLSILDVQYCNGRWVIAAYHNSKRSKTSTTSGHYIAVYAFNSGGMQKLHEVHLAGYNSDAKAAILYCKGRYYIYVTAYCNGVNFVRVLHGAALSGLSEYIPSGIRDIPILEPNGEEGSTTFHFLMNGETSQGHEDTSSDQYVMFNANHISKRTYSQYKDCKIAEPEWLVTTGPWTQGWWNHGGYVFFKSFLMSDSEDNWGLFETHAENATDQYIWQAYYEPEEEE